VQRDLSERIAAERAVQLLADQRQVLLDHLVQAQEDERARIAADVHDDSVQALAAVDLRLSLLHDELGRSQPDLLGHLDTVHDTVRGATDRLRHLLFDLESPARQGELTDALAEAAAYVLEDAVRWSVEGDGGRELPEATRVTAYRIAKEAIVNARKHAEAHHVVIEVHDRDGGVEVSVADDGRGFDVGLADDRPGHLGLPGMRDRAAVAGGSVDVASRPGSGTTVRLWLPDGAELTGDGHRRGLGT
jgi:signal transduction histidine kinase